MEFVQFMPLAILWPPPLAGFIVYSMAGTNIRGVLYNATGERFMERYYPDKKEFVQREAQARAIFKEVKEGRGSLHGGVYISLRHLPRNLISEFIQRTERGNLFENLKQYGVDIYEDGIEVYPACHYTCGGVDIDEKCRTTLKGLYAVGEVGSGAKDGADRLAGNAITFALLMGKIAGGEAAEEAKDGDLPDLDQGQLKELQELAIAPLKAKQGIQPYQIKQKVREIMSTYAFFGRTKEGLETGIQQIEEIKEKDCPLVYSSAKTKTLNAEWAETLEVRNMLDVAEMVHRAALLRTESRGLHERNDYPNEDPQWLKHILIKKINGKLALRTEQIVDFPYVTPPRR
jgi:succinate dehydrogenase/fumarate reductase flavoprotein subunit